MPNVPASPPTPRPSQEPAPEPGGPATSLAAIRKRNLLSQRDLAKMAGVALSTVYLLEAGRTERVTFKVMRAISAALGVSPESIAEFRPTLEGRARASRA